MDIDSADLTKEIGKLLDQYGTEVKKAVNEEVEKMAKDTRKRLANEARSKIDGRRYARSFAVQIKNYFGGLEKEAVIYSKKPSLTSWLEKGHNVGKQGATTRAFPHFLPVQDWLMTEFPKRITDRINKIK